MGWSKRDLVSSAFEELALAGYEFDVTPEEQNSALRRMDAMMATWDGRGVRLGYNLPSSPDRSDLDQDSGIPDWAAESVYLNLSIRMASGWGKSVGQSTIAVAKDAYNAVLSHAALPPEQRSPQTLPSGAGNKPWRINDNPFIQNPVPPLTLGQDSQLEFE